MVSPEVEAKVRNLLAMTELKEIASSARVLVEVSPDVPEGVNRALSTSKIDLKPRN